MNGCLMRAIVILAMATVGGCAGTTCCFGQDVAGNEMSVSVSNVWSEMEAIPLADQHCARYGKVARFKHMEYYRASFDCVER